jgi:hypothetical protein
LVASTGRIFASKKDVSGVCAINGAARRAVSKRKTRAIFLETVFLKFITERLVSSITVADLAANLVPGTAYFALRIAGTAPHFVAGVLKASADIVTGAFHFTPGFAAVPVEFAVEIGPIVSATTT